MILKSVLTALLWALCLFAWYVGQLPSWTFLQFRQANCFKSTSLVVWLYSVSPTDEHSTRATVLIVTYVGSLPLCLLHPSQPRADKAMAIPPHPHARRSPSSGSSSSASGPTGP
ncbi:hypothetical protein DMC30DRAFT_389869 [Rhodotorula diobovata]|uniref:Uncharacterized protein n=1 Tax=Rhodotorula diobovata TaxID=5288 RepID=A0A5C5G2P3_9BASI|nr:hypothetical protein DMC30DRAFT_389869 [Rhodotorula diobovata]